GRDVPQPDRAVEAGRGSAAAVLEEGKPMNSIRVPLERAQDMDQFQENYMIRFQLQGFGVIRDGVFPAAQRGRGEGATVIGPPLIRLCVDQAAQVPGGDEPLPGCLAVLSLLAVPGNVTGRLQVEVIA